jgi:hypothetical protein
VRDVEASASCFGRCDIMQLSDHTTNTSGAHSGASPDDPLDRPLLGWNHNQQGPPPSCGPRQIDSLSESARALGEGHGAPTPARPPLSPLPAVASHTHVKHSYGHVSEPRADPYRTGMDVHLNHQLAAQRRIPDSRPARWESWTPHSSALRKGGEGAYKQDGEITPVASSGPRLRGSTHGYTFWTCPNAGNCQYMCMAPPRPAETNTSHTGSTLWKNLAGVRALL